MNAIEPSPPPQRQPESCYQCAKCSAGCPVADEMDVLPHQLMHMVSLGMTERALRANTVWMCASCYTCAVRCPNNIDITSVIDDLRAKAVDTGVECPKPDVLTFHRTFVNDFGRRGRVHELRMMGEYNLRTGRPFHDWRIGLKMLLQKRIHIRPPRALRGFKRWMKRVRQN